MVRPDHLILVVHDIEAASADFAALGFTVQERADSRHGTARYRFICLEDGSYILLTGFTTPEAAASHRLGALLATGAGWADYSFAVASVAQAAANLAALGLPVRGPVDVGNTLVDGSVWALKLLMAGRGTDGDEALPFVIEDVAGRSFRIPAPVPHANGARAIRRLVIASLTAEQTARALATLIGGTVTAGAPFETRPAFDIDAGGCLLTVFADDPASPIGRAGGGLHAVELAGSGPAGPLDPGRAHGGRLIFVAA